jgi:hypothetical protein
MLDSRLPGTRSNNRLIFKKWNTSQGQSPLIYDYRLISCGFVNDFVVNKYVELLCDTHPVRYAPGRCKVVRAGVKQRSGRRELMLGGQ